MVDSHILLIKLEATIRGLDASGRWDPTPHNTVEGQMKWLQILSDAGRLVTVTNVSTRSQGLWSASAHLSGGTEVDDQHFSGSDSDPSSAIALMIEAMAAIRPSDFGFY